MEEFVDVSVILRAGVYLLYRRGRVVYVGKSRRLLHRLYSHRNARFDAMKVVAVADELLDATEQALIAYFKPIYNANHKPKPMLDLFKILPQLRPAPPSVQPSMFPNLRVRL